MSVITKHKAIRILPSTGKAVLKIAALAVAGLFMLAPVYAQDEPPGRVARLSYSYGNISFADAGSNNWTSLQANRPISTGDSIQVPYAGKAELHIGANALRMQDNTSISFSLLDDDNTQIDMTQGSMVLKIRELSNRENFDIRTPNLVFSLQEPGEYRININSDNTTTVQVRHGMAIARGEHDSITIRQGEQSRFAGSNLQHTMIGSVPPPDAFDLWAADRDRAEESVETARYVSREVIGYEQLDRYGAWETSVDYGPVWYPSQVSVTWAPYRDGNWVWVAPWGWTWVDRAPWGFAPYHYGRWAYIGTRWAWVPGAYHKHYRPVYAPALVAFVGNDGQYFSGSGPARNHHLGPSVAWFPLGPGESYRPGYTSNQYYIQRLNQNIVINNVVVNNNYVHLANRRAWTVVPTNTFVRGDYVLPVSNNRVITQDKKPPVVVTEAPHITPAVSNRFGEIRQRPGNPMNNGEQFRQRNLVVAPTRPEQITNINPANPNDGRQINRPAEASNFAGSGNRTMNGISGNNQPQPNNLMPAQGANVPAAVAPANTVQRGGYPNNGVPNNSNMPNNVYNPRPVINNAPSTPGASVNTPAAIVNVPPAVNNNGNNNMGVHTPATNAPVNNAIMNSPNSGRPAENVDRSQRYNGNGNTWNNNGQPEVHRERPVERGNDRIMDRPAERVMERPVERPVQVQQAPMIQPAPQQPRMESRPAPVITPPQQPVHVEQRQAPVMMPAPVPQPAQAVRMERPAPAPAAMPSAPAAAPVARPEKPKEKEEAHNPKRNLNEK
ncbi:DUF6600 domain-containing protein [Undibacterium sp. TS12]|uniref:DUF6600 domain-containing protein n=1 Tax=Undibacterium sp. TS12 TaxID=2908202 RepID=UPI001F4CE959|nr:DUF6600 domain-containing protein [Undibacterium sp. TS12]MCH8619437.1 hypothetical protein [Undibacterium sp. TS12]